MQVLVPSLSLLPIVAAFPAIERAVNQTPACHYLPGDPQWPSVDTWNRLNSTLGGTLIAGVPLAQPCYGPNHNAAECSIIANEWIDTPPL